MCIREVTTYPLLLYYQQHGVFSQFALPHFKLKHFIFRRKKISTTHTDLPVYSFSEHDPRTFNIQKPKGGNKSNPCVSLHIQPAHPKKKSTKHMPASYTPKYPTTNYVHTPLCSLSRQSHRQSRAASRR